MPGVRGRDETVRSSPGADGLVQARFGSGYLLWHAGDAEVSLLGEELLVLLEVEKAASRQVDHCGRNRSARCPVIHHQRCHGRRQSIRRGGHENGVVVDVDRVAAVRVPAEQYEGGQQ